jgi:hypothetical protein
LNNNFHVINRLIVLYPFRYVQADAYSDNMKDIYKTHRLNVVNFIKHWVEWHYFHDFVDNEPLQQMVSTFIESHVVQNDGKAVARTLSRTLDKNVSVISIKAPNLHY